MRSVALVLAALASGCLAPAAVEPAVLAPPPLPFHAEGRLWFPGSSGFAPPRTDVPFTSNATGWTIAVALRLGATYVVDAPPFAFVRAEVRDAADGTLGEAELASPGGRTAADIVVEDAPAGEYLLVAFTSGGSDGGSMGDWLDWSIDASADG